jgi:hypothetical protein
MRQASYLPAAVAALALIAVLFIGCGGGGRGGLTFRKDLASSSGSVAAPASEGAQGSANYDSQYRQAASGDEAQPGQQSGPSAPGRLTGDTLEKIGTWFSPAAYAQDTQIDEKYLIRTGDVSLEVADFDAAIEDVYEIAAQHKGLVTDSDIRNSGDNVRSGWVTLRVPNTQFFAAFTALGQLGDVKSQTIGSEDVSRQYVAAVSRLRNLTLEQDTLRKMLDEALAVQRARGLGEGYKILLDTQQRLSEVTGAIQSTEDELSQLADKITRSTIKVNVTQATKYEPQQFSWGMGATFDESKKELLAVVRGIGQGLIRFGVVGWVYLVPWLVVGWVVYRLIRRYGAKLLADKPAVKEA